MILRTAKTAVHLLLSLSGWVPGEVHSRVSADLAHAKSLLLAEQDGALALRDELGGRGREGFAEFVRRLAKERDEALAKVAELEMADQGYSVTFSEQADYIQQLITAESALTRQHAVEVERLVGERDAAVASFQIFSDSSNAQADRDHASISALESELAASRKPREQWLDSVNSLRRKVETQTRLKVEAERRAGRKNVSRLESEVARLTSELEAARGEVADLLHWRDEALARIEASGPWTPEMVAAFNGPLDPAWLEMARVELKKSPRHPAPQSVVKSSPSDDVRDIAVGQRWANKNTPLVPAATIEAYSPPSDGNRGAVLLAGDSAPYPEPWFRENYQHVSDPGKP